MKVLDEKVLLVLRTEKHRNEPLKVVLSLFRDAIIVLPYTAFLFYYSCYYTLHENDISLNTQNVFPRSLITFQQRHSTLPFEKSKS